MQPHCPHASNALLDTQAFDTSGTERNSRGIANLPEACSRQGMLRRCFELRSADRGTELYESYGFGRKDTQTWSGRTFDNEP